MAKPGNEMPLLEMCGIDKSFPGVHALSNVDLTLAKGEVLALLGENGAGKSTLIKVLGGAHAPDAGTIVLDGRPIEIHRPVDAERAGIAVIYQEFNLVPSLTVSENIFLGHEMTRAGFVRKGREREAVRKVFERIGIEIDPDALCSRLTVAQQQVVEIAKALVKDAKVLVMDEPTAALTLQETDRLFQVIADLKTHGIGIIYISHRLVEIFEIADRVTVLRDGALVGTKPVDGVDRHQLIEMMVGRRLEHEFPQRTAVIGKPRLVVENLSRGQAVKDVCFSVRSGEILGITGLVGAGRSEMARLIFGADRADRGAIRLDGRALDLRHPREAIRAGVCLLTEDRKAQGLVLMHNVRENFGLPNLARFSRRGFINERAERAAFQRYADELRIKVQHSEQRTENLSGGNQQKVVLAKWLFRNAEVLIFDEPTRGVDVGAKFEIYLIMNRLAAEGKAIIMISSELPEILGMSDRILVMHEGRVTGEIDDVGSATQEDVMKLAVA